MADEKVVFSFLLLSLPCIILGSIGSTLPPAELCGAASYEVYNLTAGLWTFHAPGEVCLHPRTGNTTVAECLFTMAFCRPLRMSTNCNNSAVCQSFGSASIDTYSVAAYANNPFNTTALPSGDGFYTNYPPGETYKKLDNKTCTLSTAMTFVCNPLAIWSYPKSTDAVPVPVKPTVHFTNGSKICLYTFRFDFAGACPIHFPGETNSLSAGSVLLMIFFVTLIMYFVMGCFINIVRGKVGQDIIPHQEFWTMLPVYIMDGIQFTLSCGEKRSSGSYDSI